MPANLRQSLKGRNTWVRKEVAVASAAGGAAQVVKIGKYKLLRSSDPVPARSPAQPSTASRNPPPVNPPTSSATAAAAPAASPPPKTASQGSIAYSRSRGGNTLRRTVAKPPDAASSFTWRNPAAAAGTKGALAVASTPAPRAPAPPAKAVGKWNKYVRRSLRLSSPPAAKIAAFKPAAAAAAPPTQQRRSVRRRAVACADTAAKQSSTAKAQRATKLLRLGTGMYKVRSGCRSIV